MSIEAMIWNYQNGEPVGFDYQTVRAILGTQDSDWIPEFGCLRVRFHDPDDVVDFHFGKEAPETDRIDGIMVARPIKHPEYLQRVFRVMQLGNVVLFYSDETIPVFVRGADVRHYPSELLSALGEPRYVDSPCELLHRT
jgi:hypothetical protein